MSARSACSTARPITAINWQGPRPAGRPAPISRATGGWLGFTDKYWLAALVPDQAAASHAAFRHAPTGALSRPTIAAPLTLVAPGQGTRYISHALRRRQGRRAAQTYTRPARHRRLERAIDWGWFRWFMKPIFYLLLWLSAPYRQFRRGDHLPDPHRAHADVPDRAEAVPVDGGDARDPAQDEGDPGAHKDDKQRMQQEIMKLYQEEKIEPGRGLPADLPPDPDLLRALQGADGLGGDAPPAVRAVDQGPVRARSADPGQSVRLCCPSRRRTSSRSACCRSCSASRMWLQMRLNPQPMDPAQRQMFALMPWVLMFVMAPFAAGLQLYWITNNLPDHRASRGGSTAAIPALRTRPAARARERGGRARGGGAQAVRRAGRRS